MQRRAHPRYLVGFGADVHTEQGAIDAGTSDVSRGGCRLHSGRAITEGATVRIDLHLTIDGIEEADFPRLSVVGRIQWTAEGEDEDGVVHISGVRFERISPADADRLEQILREHGTPVAAAPPDDDVDIDLDDDL